MGKTLFVFFALLALTAAGDPHHEPKGKHAMGLKLTDGLISYYDLGQNFDEHIRAINSVPPYSGGGSAADLALSPEWFSADYLFPQTAPGKFAGGARYYHTTATFILLGSESAPPFEFTGDRTMTFWVKFHGFDDVNALVWKGLPFGSPEWNIRVTDVTHKLIVNEAITHSDELVTDTWYFVFLTYRRSDHRWQIVVNAGPATEGIDSVTVTNTLFGIGGNPAGEYTISDFAIWDRLLSGKEMAQLWNKGDGLDYQGIIDASDGKPCRSQVCCSP